MPEDHVRGMRDIKQGFSSLTIENWRQFQSVRIAFHPQLTVLTGANGSGKTTILTILGRHFNWNRAFSSEPMSEGEIRRWRTISRIKEEAFAGGSVDIGALTYGTNTSTPIRVPQNDSTETRIDYNVELPTQQPVDGAYLTSHRIVSGNYVPVGEIPTSFANAEALFEEYTNEVRTKWQNSNTGRSPQLAFKRALIAAAIFGNAGNEYVEPNPLAQDIWKGYLQILQDVMPESIGFSSIRVRMPDVILETATGNFVIDEASGGISAILEIAWQIFLRSRTKQRFTVLIDEPENHLHPSLQREIMPSLLRAFPDVQFIVATHSPFVVTSTADSAVYALSFNANRLVEARELDYANKAASADETLRNVLGVPSTMPTWAVQVFDEIVERHTRQPLSEESVKGLRDELKRNGLATEFPEALLQVTKDVESGNN
ncbi:AAA family ATPase [Mycobacteroides chelonae]|uniref:AAA family ATPase n=1 Tax=Mycobacteroides chelonae TaxID=1774 RepID=A0AB73TZA9_MYCCH|nr:AAA family ATPase [Mycobacteroides chelonae]MEC4838974.1 AAA family ATPase [Mycobacteroides chelonae]MEC4844916.1 AAA family ATPase [Mycobacteroides chelonae]QDF69776.1 AAA family ATPase [Mycobacteroides chelonae]WED94150.1 AAA family ATPase [Mycobacteroides chelonae]WED98027.1 AAA family ATPase [Mycobacteroides chelonae]